MTVQRAGNRVFTMPESMFTMAGIGVQHRSEFVSTFDRNRRSRWAGIRRCCWLAQAAHGRARVLTSSTLTPWVADEARTYPIAPLVTRTYATMAASDASIFGIVPLPVKTRLR